MIDRRTFVTSAGAALTVAAATSAQGAVSPLDYSWQLIARSRFIVIGTPRPPEGSYPGFGEGGSIAVPVLEVRALKGTPPDPLVLDAPNIAPGFIDTQKPWEIAGRSALLFIGDESSSPPLVSLTSMSSIIPAEPEIVGAVTREIAAQAAYLKAWKPDVHGQHYGQVKTILDWLAALSPTGPDVATRQAAGFAELEALGEAAASAIVAQMNDRRPLAVHHLVVGSAANGRERTHAPQLMIDALAAVLEQLTGQGFGAPYDGGRDSQRQLAFDGWRLYAGRHMRGLR